MSAKLHARRGNARAPPQLSNAARDLTMYGEALWSEVRAARVTVAPSTIVFWAVAIHHADAELCSVRQSALIISSVSVISD